MRDLGPAMVRKGGLEPPRFYPPDPKSGASANSATFARFRFYILCDFGHLRLVRCSGNCSGYLLNSLSSRYFHACGNF
jgi:hypothetical protein